MLLRGASQSVQLDLTVTIEQDGARLTGSSESPQTGSCQLTGTVAGDTVDAELGSCEVRVDEEGVIPGCGPDPWSTEMTGAAFTATVSGESMSGTFTETRMMRSGDERHTATLTGSLALQR